MNHIAFNRSLIKRITFCCSLLTSIVSCTPIKPIAATEALATSISRTATATSNVALEIGDGGFLSGKKCGPPCFWNILPGETKKSEVIHILEDRDIYQYCQVSNESSSVGASINCHQEGTSYWARSDFIFRKGTDIVESIGFGPSQQIQLKEVIAKYGNPKFVEILEDGTTEHPTTQMSLYYDRINAFVSLPQQDDILYHADPDLTVTYIVYWDAESKANFLKDSKNIFLPWNGFGNYK